MVNIEELCAGDRVKIVDEWVDGCEKVGIVDEMNEFLGKIVTVQSTYTDHREDPDDKVFIIEEDHDKWNFNRWMIDYKVTDDDMDSMEDVSEDILSKILLL